MAVRQRCHTFMSTCSTNSGSKPELTKKAGRMERFGFVNSKTNPVTLNLFNYHHGTGPWNTVQSCILSGFSSLGPARFVGGGSECTALSPPSILRLRWHQSPKCWLPTALGVRSQAPWMGCVHLGWVKFRVWVTILGCVTSCHFVIETMVNASLKWLCMWCKNTMFPHVSKN